MNGARRTALRSVVLGALLTAPGVSAGCDAVSAQAAPRKISVSWTEAPITSVLRAFSVYSGRSIVAGADLGDVFVTADIRDQPWDVALRAILSSRGLVALEDEFGIIQVSSMRSVQGFQGVTPVVTRSYRISFERAAELRATIAPLLSERGSASVLESANTLVVSDIERVQRVVAQLLGTH